MSYNGCELIAIYNAARLLRRPNQLYDIILEFEYNLGQLIYGTFGTDPHYIGYYLSAHSFKYKKAWTLKSMNNYASRGRAFIISFWNKKWNIFKGLHTVAVYCNRNSKYEVYNYYNNSTTIKTYDSFSEIVGEGSFICGYYVY